MSQALKPVLEQLARGERLTVEQAEQTFDSIFDGDATPGQVGALLMALRVRGETVAEITGAVRSLRARMIAVQAPDGTIDTCGTGGDGRHTLNVSTAVAFVVAGCGVPVAKHGNRAVSSRCGAADVLEALGVNVEGGAAAAGETLCSSGLGFLFATSHHQAMRHVGPVRRELGLRTIVNLLGPLANPAGARRQLLGVFSADWLLPVASVLGTLGSTRAWVVHGEDGLDELTTTTRSQVAELREDGSITRFVVEPEQVGVPRAHPDALVGGDARHNARALSALLAGAGGAYRDIVVLNAAAALVVAGRADTLSPAAEMARRSLDSGAAAGTLDALVRASNELAA